MRDSARHESSLRWSLIFSVNPTTVLWYLDEHKNEVCLYHIGAVSGEGCKGIKDMGTITHAQSGVRYIRVRIRIHDTVAGYLDKIKWRPIDVDDPTLSPSASGGHRVTGRWACSALHRTKEERSSKAPCLNRTIRFYPQSKKSEKESYENEDSSSSFDCCPSLRKLLLCERPGRGGFRSGDEQPRSERRCSICKRYRRAKIPSLLHLWCIHRRGLQS